jgi:hypothetical protein
MAVADRELVREVAKVTSLVINLPHSLPASLWGWDMSDLAEAAVTGPKREAPDGTRLVEIHGRWYRADEDDAASFLKELEG